VESLVRPSMQGGPSAREFTMVFPLRPNYNLAGNYMVRTSPERRAEVMAEATEALRGNGPPRILLEDNTTTVSELRDRFYQQQRGMAWLLGVVCVALLLITALGIVG